MRRTLRLKASICLMLALVLFITMFLPISTVYAASSLDSVITVNPITVVSSGGGSIEHDSSIEIQAAWTMPSDSMIHSGDFFDITIPADSATNDNSILSVNNAVYTVYFEGAADDTLNGEAIGTMTVSGSLATGYSIHTVFNDILETHSRYSSAGKLYFNAQMIAGATESDTTYNLEFQVNATSIPVSVTVVGEPVVVPPDPEPYVPVLKINKYSSGYVYQDEAGSGALKDDIKWGINVNADCVGSPTSILIVNDSIPSGQKLVTSTLRIERSTPTSMVVYDAATSVNNTGDASFAFVPVVLASETSLYLELPAGAQYLVTFRTRAELGTTVIPSSAYSNSASVTLDGVTVGSTAWAGVEKIRKRSGSYDIANNKIDWTIDINPHRLTNMTGTPTSLTVQDSIGSGHVYKDGTLRLYRVSDLGVETDVTSEVMLYSTTTSLIRVTLPVTDPPTSHYYILRYSTTITDLNLVTYNNNVALLEGETAQPNPPSNSVSLENLYKYSGEYNSGTRNIPWTIDINKGKKVDLRDMALTDTIGMGHKLVADSLKIYENEVEVTRDQWATHFSQQPALSDNLIQIWFPTNAYYKVTYDTHVTTTIYGTYSNSATVNATAYSASSSWSKSIRSGGATGSGVLPNSKITFYKHDGATPLAGVSFNLQVYDTESGYVTLGTYTSMADGTFVISGLPPASGGSGGRYYLLETSSLPGYAPLTNRKMFTVDSLNDTKTIDIVNLPLTLTVHKQDGATGLAGAVFRLLQNGIRAKNAMGADLSDLTTNASGDVAFTYLLPGNYQLVELTSPDTYKRITTPFDVTMGTASKTVNVSNEKVTLTIHKHSGAKNLKDVEFELRNSVGTLTGLYKTDADGKIEIKGLPRGTYTLTETKEPLGYYKLAVPITIVMGDADLTQDVVNVPVQVYKPENGTLNIIKLVAEDSDVGKAFQFELTVNGGTKIPFVLSAAKSADKATGYKLTLEAGTTYTVSEVLSSADDSKYTVTVNGNKAKTVTSSVYSGVNTVTFVNSAHTPTVVGQTNNTKNILEMMDEEGAGSIPVTADASTQRAFIVAYILLLLGLAVYYFKKSTYAAE